MNLHFRTIGSLQIVTVSGVVDSSGAGRLLDALVEATLGGTDKLIVDLSGVTRMTRAGVRGVVVAAKLAVTRRGALRLSGANGSVEDTLRGLGYDHLFRFDPNLDASIAALAPPHARQAA